VNGFRFKISNNNVGLIAKYILNIFKNKNKFIKYSLNTRLQYDKRLNWDYSERVLKKFVI
jgi:hypothetical protein